MGTQRPVVIGEELTDDLGGPIAKHHGKKKEEKSSKKNVEEQIKEAKYKKEKVEETVVEEKSEGEEVGQEEESSTKEKKTKAKVGKVKIRSKKYQKALELIDHTKIYELEDALDLVKKTSTSNFDGNVEVHVRLLLKNGKPENLRGMLKYPHATGKQIKVIILDEKIMEEIQKTKKTDFDIALATPEMMPKVAKLAKILGPKGKMPNPKSGTVTSDPEKTKKELEGGTIEYKTDKYGIIHQAIGKVSADLKILEENFRTLLSVLPLEKITTLNICATMWPSISVDKTK
ncbi:MAG: hypothetical protein WCV58_02575 [Patescibacteria group bacterium]